MEIKLDKNKKVKVAHPEDIYPIMREILLSEMDQDLTDHFIQAGRFLNVEVIDHLIIGEKAYYSFLDSKLFAKLQKSKKYVLPYELEERARKEGLEEGVKKGKREMAKELKAQNVEISIIVQVSGLSYDEIVKL